MDKDIATAIIATGGFGIRMRPVTNAIPKAMLPLGRKPLIQRIVEELRESGITRIHILCRPEQKTIPEHFSICSRRNDKKALGDRDGQRYQVDRDITFVQVSDTATFCEAVLKARRFIGDEPFVLALCDEIDGVGSPATVTRMMIETYRKFGCSVVPYDRTLVRYDFADIREPYRIDSISSLERNPSDLFIVGRFLFSRGFLRELENAHRVGHQPAYLAALDVLAQRGELVAMPFDTPWWHCGEHLQYQKAFIDYALADGHSAGGLRTYIGERLDQSKDSGSAVD